MVLSSTGTYKIRPAGRHILTIGRDLIQDCYAAVVELVKNAYDADSPDVQIEFKAKSDETGYTITITDHGHGMSRETVITNWMVPSTRDKLDRRESPAGRIMQGRKGVGRYAASILGNDLLLETIASQGEKTTLFVEWMAFEEAEYLDDVDVLIETTNVAESSGTRLTMTGDSEFLGDWDQSQFDKLRFELKKLISPVTVALTEEVNDDPFAMLLVVEGFPAVQDFCDSIEPYPILELYDYRIFGRVKPEGKGLLTYSMQKVRNAVDQQIMFDAGGPTGCGELVFDIRVYDREKEAIESLIVRGLKDEEGDYVGKLQARQLLNEYNGIGVYRNGFRIRPMGDADFDWLKLNEQRVQNPSLRIGSNQVIGWVQIQSEEQSGLIEKSARDGIRENLASSQLKMISKAVIAKLEVLRFAYRSKAGLSRSKLRIESKFEQLFSYENLKQNIRSNLRKGGVNRQTVEDTISLINEDAEGRSKVVEEIQKAVAIYQGQATLGKIINVILHEGRHPLNYFRNQIPNLRHRYNSFMKTRDVNQLVSLLPIAEGIGNNAEAFVNLFSRLDPLAAGKRPERKPLKLVKTIRDSLAVFDKETTVHHVRVDVEGPDDFEFASWTQDIYAIFTNLLDNSIYWMKEKNTLNRVVVIKVVMDGDSLSFVDYRDTGPGIEPTLIDTEVIFEPQFSTKPSGTGLGLAIAGEAAARSDLELKAFESELGAWFRLQPKTQDKNNE